MTTPSQWRRVRSAFERIVDRSPASRRAQLNKEFTSRPDLKRDLEDLVAKYRSEDPVFDWADRAPADALPAQLFHEGQILAARFRIVRFLGRGGMGEVYEAVDTFLDNRPVAIKTVSAEIRHNPDSARRFRREVELAQRVTHPNISRIHDIYLHTYPDPATGAEAVIQFLAMQLLIGETLSEYIAKRGALPLTEALNLLRQMAEALAAAHAAGVIHRDFKPGNVILVPDASGLRPVITDFGVAIRTDRSLDTDGDHSLGTHTRAGTPEYASPEQRDGGRVTAATDIFALGVVALEMLTGQHGDRSLAPLSPVQRDAIARCLDPDPAARFASPSDFVNALSGDPSNAGATNRILSRRTLVTGFGTTAAVLAAGVVTRKVFFPKLNISTLSILPFEGDSGVSALPGFQEELTRIFLKSRKIRILSAYSTASLKPPFDFRKMSQILPADALLTGALTSAEVLVTLVRRGGSVIWHQKFDRHQPTLALHRQIQTAVIAVVDQGESSALLQSSYVPSQEGYLAYVNARSVLTRHNANDVAQAEALFRQAIGHDGRFAPAWAGLSYTLLVNDRMSEAHVAADRAIALDDQCAEAYLVKGMVLHRGDWKWNEAQATLQHALDLEPYNARCYQWIGATLSDLGQSGRAIPQLSEAVQLDPVSFNCRIALGICLLSARQYDDAITRLSEGIAMARASNAETSRPYPFLATSWLMKGDKTKALHYYRRALSLDPSSVEVNCHFAFGAAKCGDLTEARAALERAERLPDAALCPFDFAFAHVGLEEYDRAFEYLNRAFEIRDSDIVLLKSSIYMDPVRSDPRYLALLAKMGLA